MWGKKALKCNDAEVKSIQQSKNPANVYFFLIIVLFTLNPPTTALDLRTVARTAVAEFPSGFLAHPNPPPCFCSNITPLWTCQPNIRHFSASSAFCFFFWLFAFSLHTSFTSFHSLGLLCHKCQSPLVSAIQPAPRPLSLVQPRMMGAYANRNRPSPMQRTFLVRARSLPSHGIGFPSIPVHDAVGGYTEDEYGLREYFC